MLLLIAFTIGRKKMYVNLLRRRKSIRKMQSNCIPDREKLRLGGDVFSPGPGAFTNDTRQMNILGIYSIITYSLFYRAAMAKSNTKIKIISFRILSAFVSMFNLNPITLHLDSTLYVSYDKIMNCTII